MEGFLWKAFAKLSPHQSKSSVETEYYAASGAREKASYFIFLEETGFAQNGPVVIYCCSESCIAMIKNPEFYRSTKHIECRCHFIRSKVKSNEMEFFYSNTDQMVADAFTESLSKAKFEYCKSRLGV